MYENVEIALEELGLHIKDLSCNDVRDVFMSLCSEYDGGCENCPLNGWRDDCSERLGFIIGYLKAKGENK